MACARFYINDSGKAVIEGVPELDILSFSNGKRYLVDKAYLAKLSEYSSRTLENTPIYLWIGANKEETQGITAEVRKLGKLNELEKFIENIKEINPKI